MIYYTEIEYQDHGLLVCKVIGVDSQKKAQKITLENQGKLMLGKTLEGPPIICPLFSVLKPKQKKSRALTKIRDLCG